MVNRKKRIKKGIESIQEQIEIHKEKLSEAIQDRKMELIDYYEKEIRGLEKSRINKEELI